jgi:hypothetical protein
MIDQQPENTITSDDLFAIIGRQTVENIKLREQLSASAVKYNEVKKENTNLVENAVKYEDHIHDLEGQIARLKNLGPDAAAIADQGAGVIQETGFQLLESLEAGKEKAAPVDGSG